MARSKSKLACTFLAEAGIGSRPGGTKGPAQNLWPRLHFVADWKQWTGTARPKSALKRTVQLRLKLAAGAAGCGGIAILCGLCLNPLRRWWVCSGRRKRPRAPPVKTERDENRQRATDAAEPTFGSVPTLESGSSGLRLCKGFRVKGYGKGYP